MKLEIPKDQETCEAKCGRKRVTLTNLKKIFWPQLGKTKRDLLLYYAAVADCLIPHLKNRAMVMKRYPNGIEGKFFFMKRTPEYRPEWLETCSIPHRRGNIIDFPVAQDLASLLWIVNLGCIDLNQWYGQCDDPDRPDYLHFDLDPVPPAGFAQVREAALLIHDDLWKKKVKAYAKTTGSRGVHIYVPIQRQPKQKEVWTVAKRTAIRLADMEPGLLTSEYRIEKRPPGRVLVDYNQNAWGRTLASVYSVRPKPEATVSAPVTWEELEQGVDISDFTMDTMPKRLAQVGDLFSPLLRSGPRCPPEALQ
ncbi:MAG TPA: non-homologous end-joining DNA ligase [Bryobacteraceae bacterium]|nr:non-homologous end-joining DNA ligase [Bryobacteraceae bacterium]